MDREKIISNLQGVYEYLRHFENTAKMGEWVADALELLKKQEEQIDTQRKNLMILLNEPRIIRCKDCKHGNLYMTEDVCGKTLIECNNPEIGDSIAIHGWDWFCADGELK